MSAIYSGVGSAKADSVIATIPVGTTPFGIFAIAFDSANGNLYVTDEVHNVVFVISGQTNTVIGNPIPVGQAPEAIAFDSANGNLYVTNTFDHDVSVISGQTNTVIGSPIVVGPVPVAIAFDSANGNLYVTNNGDSTVSVIFGSSNTVIGTIPIVSSSQPNSDGIAFDSANGNLYVTSGDGTVSIISGETNKVVGSPILVGQTPIGIAFNAANRNLYVANRDSDTVSVISDQTNTVIGTIPVGTFPAQIAFNSANGNMYVTNAHGNTVSVISDQTNTVIGTISVGKFPVGIAFDSANDNMYVVNNEDGTVSVISTVGLKPPHTTIDSAIDGNGAAVQNGGTTLSSSITFAFTATPGTNPIAGFQCSLDNSQLSSCTSPAAFKNLAAGPHKFTVVAVDTAGNKDPNPASFSWIVTSSVSANGNTQTNTATNHAQNVQNVTQSITQRNIIIAGSTSSTLSPVANAGPNQLVSPGSLVVLNGAGSYDPSGGTIISYSWMQISGTPVALSGAHTTTPSFTTPVIPTDTVLGFSLRVMDNHGTVSNNPAVVYVMVKHITTNVPGIVGGSGTQPHQQHPLQSIIPNKVFPIPSQPNVRIPQLGSFRP